MDTVEQKPVIFSLTVSTELSSETFIKSLGEFSERILAKEVLPDPGDPVNRTFCCNPFLKASLILS
jgi:hypothetical protein